MGSRLIAFCSTVGVLAAFAAAAHAKPAPGDQPPWLEASERAAIATLFGHPRLTEVGVIPFARTISVVFEFQSVVICRTCTEPRGAALRGRVVRLAFDRRTHALTGSMKFCETRGAEPPLSACYPSP